MWQSLPVELKIEILNLCSGIDKINFGLASGDQSLFLNKEIWREVTLYHHSEFSRCRKYLGALRASFGLFFAILVFAGLSRVDPLDRVGYQPLRSGDDKGIDGWIKQLRAQTSPRLSMRRLVFPAMNPQTWSRASSITSPTHWSMASK